MDYWHKKWCCPFYAWSDRQRVCCENGARLVFPDKEAAVAYMDGYCASLEGYHGCTVAAMLEEYYAREDRHAKQKQKAAAGGKRLAEGKGAYPGAGDHHPKKGQR